MKALKQFIFEYVGDPLDQVRQNEVYLKFHTMLFEIHKTKLQQKQKDQISKRADNIINGGKPIDMDYVIMDYVDKGYSKELELVFLALKYRTDIASVREKASVSLRDAPDLASKLNSAYCDVEETWKKFGSVCFWYAGERKHRPVAWHEEDLELLQSRIHLEALYDVISRNSTPWNGNQLVEKLHRSFQTERNVLN
jgi:hypothetical protein